MSRPEPISVPAVLSTLTFLATRTPTTTAEESKDAFAELAPYRDGSIVVGHWAGNSEWERHPADEIVMVVDGATTIFFLTEDSQQSAPLGPGDLVVVPGNTWHRFETVVEVRLLGVSPQPSEYRATDPT